MQYHILRCSALGRAGRVRTNQLRVSFTSLLSTPSPSRSPHGNTHYGSPINTFTVRPGTRHPISYAYPGTHRKATS